MQDWSAIVKTELSESKEVVQLKSQSLKLQDNTKDFETQVKVCMYVRISTMQCIKFSDGLHYISIMV